MAVKLRLMRMGKKKQPTYRVVAADARSPRNGRFIEILGFYDPRSEPSTIDIDNDKAVNWLREGAQPTERVEKLLKISGAWTDFTGEAPPPAVTRAGAADDATEEAPESPAAEAAAEEPAAEEAVAEAAEPAEGSDDATAAAEGSDGAAAEGSDEDAAASDPEENADESAAAADESESQ